ncbi:MAG: hypothetical protein WCA48_21180 [Pseudomonas gingeri]
MSEQEQEVGQENGQEQKQEYVFHPADLVEYTTVKVKFVHDDGRFFTIVRELSASSKPNFYDEEGKAQTLGVKHNPRNMSSVSNQFLNRLGLNGKLLLRGTTSLSNASFTLRDFEKIFLMDETRIVADYSPLGTGQNNEGPKEKSILKLLLTGKDDAGVKQAKKELESKGALRHKATAVEGIIKQFYPGNDAAESLELQKLSSFVDQVALRLKLAEQELEGAFHSSEDLFTQKANHISALELIEGKIAEDKALLSRFAARTGKSKEEATQIVDNYAQAYQQAMQKFEELKQQAEQKAREAGEIAAKQISRAAWSTLVMLLLGAALSFLVGRMALTNRRIPTA